MHGQNTMMKNSQAAAEGVSTGQPAETLLEVHALTKKFGGVTAVSEVSLTIRRGEIFALLGGSGSGKSTLLRMLAGFETPNEGRIKIENRDITDLPPYRRPVNMMFQSYALFPHMTVAQNIAYGLKQDRLPRAEIDARVAAMLRLVQMGDYAARKPDQLSGGQRQRVALARSLAKRPQLLLLDEPMGALDKKLRTQMQLELAEIIHRVGVTCVMVTHDQEEAMTMADRIAVMNHGRIEQIGHPTEVYEAPTNRMVCEFIGSVNMFSGQIARGADESPVFTCSDLQTAIVLSDPDALRGGDHPAFYALRPEKITLSRPEAAPIPAGMNSIAGVVQEVAYLGGQSVFHVRLASGFVAQCVVPNTDAHGGRPQVDAPVFLSWASDAGTVLRS